MALNKKVIRTMLQHKSRYIGSILLLFFSSIMLVMMNMTARNLDHTFSTFSEQNALGDAEFSVQNEIDAAALAAQFSAKVEKGGTADCEVKPGQTLRVFSLMDEVNIPAVREGTLPGKGEVMLDVTFAAKNEYKIGDSIKVAGKPMTVSGVGYLPNYIYIIQSKDTIMNDFKTFGAGVVSKEDFASLPAQTTVYAIRFDRRDMIKTQETAVKNEVRSQNQRIVSWQSIDKKIMVSYIPMEISVIGTMSAAVPSAMLLLSCILLGMMMWRMIEGESVMIGTLYAQGYRAKELRRHYLAYPVIVSLIGSVTGALLGLFLYRPMFAFLLSAFPMPRYEAVFNPWLLVIAIVVPIVLLGAVSLLVMNKILRTAPADLMKGAGTRNKTNFLEKSMRAIPLPFPAKFRIREQLRSLSRSCFLLLGVVAATMLLLYGFTMKSSVDYMLGEGIQDLYKFDNEYVFKERKTGTAPEGSEPFSAAYVSFANNDDLSFYISGILPDTKMINQRDTSGRQLDGRSVTITEPLAQKLGVKEGDELSVFDTEDGTAHTIVIEKLAASYAGDFIYMPIEEFNAEFGRPLDSYDGIWVNGEMTFPAEEIKSTKSIAQTIEAFQTLIAQMGPMIYGLIGAAFVVGLIIIYVVTGLVVDENRNTISLFKIFGYRKQEINSLILDSNTILVIIGYLLGIPALLSTVGVFYRSLTESLQLVMPVKLNLVYMLLGFVIVLLTFEAAKRMCRKKVTAVPMSEQIKEEAE